MRDTLAVTGGGKYAAMETAQIVALRVAPPPPQRLPVSVEDEVIVVEHLRLSDRSLAAFVEQRAKRAIAAGADGVIASGLEAARLRTALGSEPLIVTPGIRPADTKGGDDQRRVVTPTRAFSAGADHIVVGRPIRDAADPRRAALSIQEEIAALFG